uniref:Putative lipocalin lipocalin n=1 Tax=Ixodes ricinus TaxID=34613 RepID=A0A6B0V2Q3_IXORI
MTRKIVKRSTFFRLRACPRSRSPLEPCVTQDIEQGQSQAEKPICDGDFPNTTEVIGELPRTYMLQSAFNVSTLDCAVQVFYNKSYRKKTFTKYNLVYVYTTGEYQDQPLYVRGFQNYTILLGYRPEEFFSPEKEEQILYSDMKSCMVTQDPNTHFPNNACSLLVTKETFFHPDEKCTKAFRRHCGPYSYNYTSILHCVNRIDFN